MRSKSPLAIPFISIAKSEPPATEDFIFGALKAVMPGLTHISLTSKSGTDFFGSNVRLRDCAISAGVHPAIEARSSGPNNWGNVFLHIPYFGRADFIFRNSRRLSLRPSKAALIKNIDWNMSSTDYGGIVLSLPEDKLISSLTAAGGIEASIADAEEFSLLKTGGAGVCEALQALQMMYQPELAQSGICDEYVLATVTMLILQGRRKKSTGLQDRMSEVVAKSRDIFQDKITTEFSVAELADRLSISERYLQMAFQVTLGIGPKQWMLSERLMAAKKKLLADPSVSVAKLAEEFCFSSPAHFSTSFRKAFGISPTRLNK